MYEKPSISEKLIIIRMLMNPFSPLELWLDWFKDEMHLIALPAQKAYVGELFEKAVKDYMSKICYDKLLLNSSFSFLVNVTHVNYL